MIPSTLGHRKLKNNFLALRHSKILPQQYNQHPNPYPGNLALLFLLTPTGLGKDSCYQGKYDQHTRKILLTLSPIRAIATTRNYGTR